MKYTIAICDDEQIQIDILKNYINKFVSITNKSFNILTADSGEELIYMLKNKKNNIGFKDIDIFILDIEMKDMNGMELGEKIREENPSAIIIYVTGFKDYALEAFKLRAFNYIIKPLTYEDFDNNFKEILENLELKIIKESLNKEFIIDNKVIFKKIKYNDILYFEKRLRKIRMVCQNETIEFYSSFKDLKTKLDMNYFVQCYQSFIVNKNKIHSYKDKQVYINECEEYIPVSKGSIQDVKEILTNRLFS